MIKTCIFHGHLGLSKGSYLKFQPDLAKRHEARGAVGAFQATSHTAMKSLPGISSRCEVKISINLTPKTQPHFATKKMVLNFPMFSRC